jgi:Cd2+/Zn2+-exporting ATPase
VVVALAAAVAVLPPLVFAEPWSAWVYRARVFLVISCPCALVLSTPVSIVSALAGAAKKGVLIKGGRHLETLGRVSCVAFDKTGTLTHGTPAVVGVLAIAPRTRAEVLELAASIESRSEHPIGRAIRRAARDEAVEPAPCDHYQALPGRGASAVVHGAPVVVGSRRLFEERGWYSEDLDASVSGLEADDRTIVLLAADGRPAGIIAVADAIRQSGREAIALLRRTGVQHIVMLTGDHASSAERVGAAMDLTEVRAGLLPQDKLAAIRDLKAAHGIVAMVGDGVNDAPALAAADVGIAMGAAGSDAALETADVALMSDELLRIPYAVRLSRSTVRNIQANIAVSLGLKAVFLALAAVGMATLWMAVVADMGASLLVIANGLRLLRFD